MQASQDLRASRDSSSNPPEESTEGCLDWWNEEKLRAALRAGLQQILGSIVGQGEASEHILEAFGRAKYSQRTAYSIAALPAPSYAVQTVFGSLCAFSNFSKHA